MTVKMYLFTPEKIKIVATIAAAAINGFQANFSGWVPSRKTFRMNMIRTRTSRNPAKKVTRAAPMIPYRGITIRFKTMFSQVVNIK